MLTFFRRGLTAKLMLLVLGLVLLAIVITGFGSGGMGLGELGSLNGAGVVKVGSQPIRPDQVTYEANRELDMLRRQQQPDIDMASFVRQGGLDSTIDRLIAYDANMIFGRQHGLAATKEMVDREIAAIPGFQNAAGKFDENQFRRLLADQKITEAQLRHEIARTLILRQLLLPAQGSAIVPAGLAYQYGSLLLEGRTGSIGVVPVAAIPAGTPPTDAEIANFYRTSIGRYTIPERRVIRYAMIGPDQVAGQAKASEADILAAYKAKADLYAARETRVLQQVVLPAEAAAKAFAQKLAAGTPFEVAAAQAGFATNDIAIGEQSREAFAKIASPAAAEAAFAAAKGAATAPVRSPFGWNIVRVVDIKTSAGKPIEAVRGELVAEIERRKAEEALNDYTAKVEEAVSNGASFDEVIRANKLKVVESPPVTGAGTAPDIAGWTAPPELVKLVEPAFASAPEDSPTVETVVPSQLFALVSVARVVAPAAPPLDGMKDKVRADLVASRALARAKAVATEIVARINKGMEPVQAFAEAKLRLPPVQTINATRREIGTPEGRQSAHLGMLFALADRKAGMMPAPNGQAFLIVRLDRIVKGDANKEPAVIQAVQSQFAQLLGDEYAGQFSNAVQAGIKIKRDEKAIAELKARLAGGGGGGAQ